MENYDKNELIDKLFIDLYQDDLAEKMKDIYDNNYHIIGKRIYKQNTNFDNKYKKWVKVYHGTKYKYLFSILKNGLKMPGEILENGIKIRPMKGHIDFGKTIFNQKNWAKAIFVSPSIFYSSNPVIQKELIQMINYGV